jgi:hypothetical protein
MQSSTLLKPRECGIPTLVQQRVKIFSCPVREARRPLSLTGLVAPESRSADNTIMGSWRTAGGAYLEVYRLRKNSLLSCSRSLKWSVSESGGSFDESLRRFDRRLFDRPAARFGVPLSCHRRIYLDGRTETHREPFRCLASGCAGLEGLSYSLRETPKNMASASIQVPPDPLQTSREIPSQPR